MKLNTSRIVNSIVLFFLVTFLAACTSQPKHSSGTDSLALTFAADSTLLEEVSEILTSNSEELSFLIPSGPRQGKALTAEVTYFAASGRFCRKVEIRDSLSKELYIACKADAAMWELTPVAI
ncbi:hypothetical protein [Amphritea sp.]|uniref:hypothetical protein n=1 Tax=Amphritea sp. TaxID=1872502 RepID=UPI0025BE5D2B|nr:hypothetical protein [Amphritea sp.]